MVRGSGDTTDREGHPRAELEAMRCFSAKPLWGSSFQLPPCWVAQEYGPAQPGRALYICGGGQALLKRSREWPPVDVYACRFGGRLVRRGSKQASLVREDRSGA